MFDNSQQLVVVKTSSSLAENERLAAAGVAAVLNSQATVRSFKIFGVNKNLPEKDMLNQIEGFANNLSPEDRQRTFSDPKWDKMIENTELGRSFQRKVNEILQPYSSGTLPLNNLSDRQLFNLAKTKRTFSNFSEGKIILKARKEFESRVVSRLSNADLKALSRKTERGMDIAEGFVKWKPGDSNIRKLQTLSKHAKAEIRARRKAKAAEETTQKKESTEQLKTPPIKRKDLIERVESSGPRNVRKINKSNPSPYETKPDDSRGWDWNHPSRKREELVQIERGLHVSKGFSGKAVQETASMLKELGYDVGNAVTDGKFKNKMEAAVVKFQKANNLEPDGIVGINTLKAIRKQLELNKTK